MKAEIRGLYYINNKRNYSIMKNCPQKLLGAGKYL
jgi:hypothetical protein